MAVQAQYGRLPGVVPAPCLPRADEAEARAVREYGALLSAAVVAANEGYGCAAAAVVVSGAQSELTCNGRGGGVNAVAGRMGRKRGREAVELEQYMGLSPSSAALLEAALTSTSRWTAAPPPAAAFGNTALVSELCRQGAEVDALVWMECERLRAGLEQARKWQCQALVRAASAAAAARLRGKEAELDAARRRAAELEERLRQAASESQAWCSVARSNEAVATGLRATLDHLLRAAAPPPAEGFGDSDPAAAADDAQSCFFGAAKTDAPNDDATTSPAGKWACKRCGEREASVLLLPCRHLCLCKVCEPRLDACPVCLAAKNASIHVATN